MSSVQEQASAVIELIRKTVGDLKSSRGLLAILRLVPDIVKSVESASKQYGIKGADKKALAVEVALNLVPLPWWLPKPLLKLVLDYAIEAAVGELNKVLNKNAKA